MGDFYGLLGEKLGHSISPLIHSMIFNELNMKACYHLFEINREDLNMAVDGLKVLKAKGVNVTIPYKVDVMRFIDQISPEAEKIGAVNTICFKDGKTIGYNTDYYGFGMMLEKNDIIVNGKKFVVLGSGGAAKGVIQYLVDNSADDVVVVSRSKERANFGDIPVILYNELQNINDYDTIINCTPCGMYPNIDRSPVDMEILSKFSNAVDLIYNPKETLFLKYAKEINIKYVNGLYMLVAQGVVAEELWNDIIIGKDIIDKVYETILVKY